METLNSARFGPANTAINQFVRFVCLCFCFDVRHQKHNEIYFAIKTIDNWFMKMNFMAYCSDNYLNRRFLNDREGEGVWPTRRQLFHKTKNRYKPKIGKTESNFDFDDVNYIQASKSNLRSFRLKMRLVQFQNQSIHKSRPWIKMSSAPDALYGSRTSILGVLGTPWC